MMVYEYQAVENLSLSRQMNIHRPKWVKCIWKLKLKTIFNINDNRHSDNEI